MGKKNPWVPLTATPPSESLCVFLAGGRTASSDRSYLFQTAWWLCPALVSLPRARRLWGNWQGPVGVLCVQEAAGCTPSESWKELGLLRLGRGVWEVSWRRLQSASREIQTADTFQEQWTIQGVASKVCCLGEPGWTLGKTFEPGDLQRGLSASISMTWWALVSKLNTCILQDPCKKW